MKFLLPLLLLFSAPLGAEDIDREIDKTYKTIWNASRLACFVAMERFEDLDESEFMALLVNEIRNLDGWIYAELTSRRELAHAAAEAMDLEKARSLIDELKALEAEALMRGSACGDPGKSFAYATGQSAR